MRCHEELSLRDLYRLPDILRVLCSGDGDWHLAGTDLIMAKALFSEDGVVGFSRAFFEGDRIRIADGFLKQYEGQIIRVNKRAKTAQIRVKFEGKTLSLWLGYELIDRPNDTETAV